jgi:8-oxo-dGTP pyrophosphatase MutT (NUDIX family)
MSDRGPEQQYGALPWRWTKGVEILLITSRETRRWLIPKGWPIGGMSPAEGAAQEAFEEAGIRGDVKSNSVGSFNYEKKLKLNVSRLCRVAVFPLEVTEVLEDWPEAHERQRRWFPADEAAGLVGEIALAKIIRDFARGLSGQVLPAPTYSQAVWHQLARGLRFLGLR